MQNQLKPIDSSSPRQQAIAAIAQLAHFQLKLVVKFIQLLQWLPGSQPKPEQTASETTDPLEHFILVPRQSLGTFL